jgi:signal transduction histidine kinase
MARKYAGQHIDVVIAVTDQSFRFALDHRADLFPDAPIVYMGLSTPDAAIRTSGPGVTGMQVSNAYGQTLSAALAMHPGTERVFVVANAPDAAQVARTRSELAAASGGVPLVFLDQGTVSKLVDAARAVPQHSLILFMWHTPQDPGNLLYSDRIAQLVADAAPVPVYGTSDFYVGRGLVGGVVRSTRESGARLGDLAGRILSGERAADIPIEAARVVPTFDWRQLRRWGVDPAQLPAGSDVQFRVPTAWEAYRPYIVGTIVVVSAQLALIMALVAARARARRAEATVRTRETTLRTSYDRIRHLAGRLIHAQEATRATVARDLHDGVCQDLAGLSIAIASLQRTSGDLQDSPIQEELGKIQAEARNTYDEIRKLSHDLHPSTLRLLGIATTLKAHCAEIAKRHGVHVAFNVDGHLGSLEPDVAVSLFRIAQESLRNGVVHGKARSLSVSLTRSAEWIEMTVTDDGEGFDVERVRGSGSGLGLVSMEERAHAFGGDVHVESRPGHGTVTRVRCPAAAADAGVSTAAG